MEYEITKDLIPDLPRIPFRNGNPEGIVLHATATWEDSDTGERAYESRTWQNAFVHAFVDHDSITQVADTDYIAYGAGSVANKRYLHIELCQSRDFERFCDAFERWTWLAAFWLRAYGLQPVEGLTLWSHHMVSVQLGGTNHTDPDDYLAYHGIEWADVVQDVQLAYQEMEDESMTTEERQAFEELQATVKEQAERIDKLEGLSDIPAPTWAQEAAAYYADRMETKTGSYDFWRELVIQYRIEKGITVEG
jgi:N-acetylmuramoyl-L-alanine amidase CwlA